jgi:hypothetical protein
MTIKKKKEKVAPDIAKYHTLGELPIWEFFFFLQNNRLFETKIVEVHCVPRGCEKVKYIATTAERMEYSDLLLLHYNLKVDYT